MSTYVCQTQAIKIAKELTNNKAILVKDLEEAVEKQRVTKPGTTILYSHQPAASYGLFKNFEERGEKYKKLIAKIKSEQAFEKRTEILTINNIQVNKIAN